VTEQVTATVGGSVGIGTVIIHYAEGLTGPFKNVVMLDDGAHGDGTTGDGVYGAEIPSFPVGSYVRYYIEARASDTVGTVSFLPAGAEHDVFVLKISAPVADSTPVIINEFMAANQTTIQDPQGEYDDWIELMNVSNQEVDLSGIYLSDKESDLRKWAIPKGTTLAPGAFLIVWADGDTADTPGLHASFNLSKSGESVLLVDTDAHGNAILDSLSFGEQKTDVSYGRYPDGTGKFMVLSTPTSLTPNTYTTSVQETLLESFTLQQNYPNPFNNDTVISFSLPQETEADLSVYNLVGQKVVILARGTFHTGTYRLHWNGKDEQGRDLASGTYLYRLQAGTYSKMRRLLLLR
jgi:hypothetical protein